MEESKIKKYFKMFIGVIPFLIFAIFLFITISALFGTTNALLGIVFLFFAKMMMYSKVSTFNYVKYGMLFVIAAIIATIASFNIWTSVILNFGFLFILTFAYSNDFAPKNHFLIGLEFVLLQMNRGTIGDISDRVLAVLYALLVTYIFVLIMKGLNKKPDSNPFIYKGYSLVGDYFQKLSKGKIKDISVNEIYSLTSKYCKATYNDVIKQDGLLNDSQKYNFHVLLSVEHLIQLIYETNKNHEKLTKDDLNYFKKLSLIFKKSQTHVEAYQKLDRFLKKNKLSVDYMETDFRLALSSLSALLKSKENMQSNKTPFWIGFKFKMWMLKHRVGLDHFQFRFALQTALVVSLCFAISDVLPIINSYWIPITAYTTLTTYPDDTLKDTWKRILGTIVGLIVFGLVTQFIPDDYRLLVTLLLGFTIMLCTTSPFVNMIFGSQMAVACLYPDMSLSSSMLLRVSFVIIGSIIVIVVIRAFLHTKKQDAFKFKLRELIKNNQYLIIELKHTLNTNSRGPYIDEFIMLSHLIIDELEILSQSQDVYDEKQITKLLNYNYRFIIEMRRISMEVTRKDIPKKEINKFIKELDKLSMLLDGKVLEEVPKSKKGVPYTEYHLTKSGVYMNKFMYNLKNPNKKQKV